MVSGRYIPALDGWRAVAILLVLVSHIIRTAGESVIAVKLGAFGVGIFFAISGYLICSRLLQEEDATGQICLKDFYVRRVFRIIPPVVIYLLTLAVLGSAGVIALRDGELPSALLFTANYWPAKSWFTAHFWSLAIEEHFYMLFPAVLVTFGRRRTILAGLAMIAMMMIWRPFALAQIPSGAEVNPWQRTDFRFDSLLDGCLIAICISVSVRARAFFTRVASPALLAATALLLAAAEILAMWNPWLSVHEKTLQAFLIAAVVAATTLKPESWVGAVLEWPALRFIGRISYSIYLWQQLWLYSGTEWLPLRIVAIFVSALLVYYFIEKPMMDVGRKLAPGSQRQHFPQPVTA